MNIVYRLYGLILIVMCVGCSKEVDLEQPTFDMANYDIAAEYIMVIGDIQTYTNEVSNRPYFRNTMDWISLAKSSGIIIDCVLQVDDITNNNSDKEYSVFHDYTSKLATEIPFVACIGNHDYYWNKSEKIENRDNTPFSKYVTFDNAKAVILERFEPDRMENIVVENYIFGKPYDILVLEFGARTEVVAWAKKYVENHKDRRFILLTHEFLTRNGEIVGDDSHAQLQLVNTTCSNPVQLWNELVTCNDNIACVVCGHNGFSKMRLSENDFGREVPQILFNLQYQDNGGDGMVEIWKIEHDSDSVSVGVYNTLLNEWVTSSDTSFKFKYRY